ncbi:IMP dehydrogenase [Leptospira tipperaryensis]|uniref:IMP dehydrogenase n=1 Tax=Leptospira tipperaryensis TaxID=2564040 RepID=A0A1D7UVI8_9LEPT|nr:transglutaminase family protein [Leptospira tipperaryensis]AOP33606.1 IMP dehydrogenase [Leptospira tipperaryensis]
MSIRVALTHETIYQYDRKITLSPHVIRLRPAPHCKTNIVSYSLKVEPEKQFLNWQQDPFGNFQARLVFPEKTDKLSVLVDLVVDMKVINPFDFFVEAYAEDYPFEYEEILKLELAPYLTPSENGTLLQSYLKALRADGITEKKRIIDFIVELNRRISSDIGYIIRLEPGVQTCEDSLQKRTGSCRDSSFLLVQILRHFGLAARFVSGYLIQLKADQTPLEGPKGPEKDFTDLHAWAEVFLPGAGWVGMDPTSGLLTGEGHIPLAATPEPMSAAPIFGYADPAETTFGFRMEVERILESPRVTLPYAESKWTDILRRGKALDHKIRDLGLEISIGGEPTFISDKDREGAEWNHEALGEEKFKLSKELMYRLKKDFTSGSLLQFSQGKWYPGEPLPRWSMNCFWRKDEVALWNEDSLLIDTPDSPKKKKEEIDAHKASETLACAICRTLGIDLSYMIPMYEDNLYYLWKEANLPFELEKKLATAFDTLERQRLLKVLDKGFKKEVAFAIPVYYNYLKNEWESSVWNFRREKLFLIPGDSPAGLRIPFSSISDRFREIPEFTSIEKKPNLPSRKVLEDKIRKRVDTPPKMFSEKELPIQSTLVVEVRDGVLHVFLPPVPSSDVWVDLIASVEQATLASGFQVRLEGYEPARDERIGFFRITPDPGVIEVNLHPSTSFAELENKTKILYERALETKLSTEKFQVDGRASGTGGGNHITVGALTPEESPFLKRPDLLRSLATYWQHHPSLSYLFSGLFIGTTSQSPRMDEGREEILYEFEVACRQVDNLESVPPWLIDRLFRNLLVDITGNTHRSEISIDKLYSPTGSTGRLGLVEFRAFEMPPHYKMSVVQQMFVLSLLCRFWEKPYKHPPIRRGTELHDKYLLPFYVWEDFKDVLKDLKEHGYPFYEDDFIPFFEFRFPEYGHIQKDTIKIEVRMALEPWDVLGEEANSFGTSRAVDAALERIQVKVEGWIPERYILSCNGYEVPLRATGKNGEAVAGVRFKAWAPVFTLHPNLPITNPLVFDLWDTWSERSIGGCKYFISHPGGRSYDTFPVNSFEAESRRISRFLDQGHTAGATSRPKNLAHPHSPYTLDLRLAPGPGWKKKTS